MSIAAVESAGNHATTMSDIALRAAPDFAARRTYLEQNRLGSTAEVTWSSQEEESLRFESSDALFPWEKVRGGVTWLESFLGTYIQMQRAFFQDAPERVEGPGMAVRVKGGVAAIEAFLARCRAEMPPEMLEVVLSESETILSLVEALEREHDDLHYARGCQAGLLSPGYN